MVSARSALARCDPLRLLFRLFRRTTADSETLAPQSRMGGGLRNAVLAARPPLVPLLSRMWPARPRDVPLSAGRTMLSMSGPSRYSVQTGAETRTCHRGSSTAGRCALVGPKAATILDRPGHGSRFSCTPSGSPLALHHARASRGRGCPRVGGCLGLSLFPVARPLQPLSG